MASSLFNLHAWQTFYTISVQVFFDLPRGLAPSTSYSMHFLVFIYIKVFQREQVHYAHKFWQLVQLMHMTANVTWELLCIRCPSSCVCECVYNIWSVLVSLPIYLWWASITSLLIRCLNLLCEYLHCVCIGNAQNRGCCMVNIFVYFSIWCVWN